MHVLMLQISFSLSKILLVREDLSPDLKEIKDIIKKVKTAEQFAEFMGVQPDRFDFYLAQKAALSHYTQGVAEFSRMYEDLDRVAVTMYRCSWCGNPSALLRKCRGCSKARYCDVGCQKSHWRDNHKKVCKSSSSG
ncbi:unnamed protein product [Cyclocybe aegerita]|uniref:MYND-type domain-containing protein n=1 Tax=Cyclocybe aegerita TaxID=1973307 RepID=A0A8S0VTX2_CYCAE|nr:unnamed protein product [Cyclocybe aegerita]